MKVDFVSKNQVTVYSLEKGSAFMYNGILYFRLWACGVNANSVASDSKRTWVAEAESGDIYLLPDATMVEPVDAVIEVRR